MLKTVFLGNWGLGLEVLRALDNSDHVEVAAVIGRFEPGSEDPWRNVVYDYAVARGLAFTPESELDMLGLGDMLAGLGPDLMVMHSFMRILPRKVFSLPRLGTVNIHASLLPAYRGPSPTYWVLKNREEKTGLTAHFVDEGVDSGDIVNQVEVEVLPGDAFEDVLERQKLAAPDLVRGMLEKLMQPGFKALPQDGAKASYAPRPEREA